MRYYYAKNPVLLYSPTPFPNLERIKIDKTTQLLQT